MLNSLEGMVDRSDLAWAVRRTMLGAVAMAVLALAGLTLLGHVFVALGVCVGLAAGIWNFRMAGAAVSKVAASSPERPKGPLAVRTITRLGAVTALALTLLVVEPAVGVGMLVGLIAFQFGFLANLAWAVFRQGALR